MTGLRVLLGLIAAVNAIAGYAFLFLPAWLSRIYVLTSLGNVEHFFAMTTGALLIVLAIGALLALLQPESQKGIVTMLVLAHFALFIVDVIVLSRGQLVLRQLFPEMIYHLLVVVGLIRFFPTLRRMRVEEKKEDAAPTLEIAEASLESSDEM